MQKSNIESHSTDTGPLAHYAPANHPVHIHTNPSNSNIHLIYSIIYSFYIACSCAYKLKSDYDIKYIFLFPFQIKQK